MAGLPLFYQRVAYTPLSDILLDEETAKHMIQVLRMKEGERLTLADGEGHSATAEIIRAEKKKCTVRLLDVTAHERSPVALHLCVAFTKNTSRNEWLLEKATECGVSSIIPISSARTEREKFRTDRWQNILVSAMLQSQQYYLPQLHPVTPVQQIIASDQYAGQKLIAHCIDELPRKPVAQLLQPGNTALVLIGPEGDFTKEEAGLAAAAGFESVSLCSQRLRTETAAMSVCAYFNLINHV